MQIDTDKMAQDCINAFNNTVRNLKRLNIIVTGKSGVGKSTLINSIFKDNFAETGIGHPVTQNIRKIEKKDYPLAIYDTPGFEMSGNQQRKVKDQILDIISQGYAKGDANEEIHCIWYCINVAGNRIDDSEIKWLKELTSVTKKSIPIVIVLTQAIPEDKAAEMKKLVEAENLNVAKVIPVLAQDMKFGKTVIDAYGLDTLIEIMAGFLPSDVQNTLQYVQIASLKSKKRAARGIVAGAVAASLGEGYAPIPFSDALLIVPTQIGMIAGITAVFGIDINKGFLTGVISSTIGTGGATLVGKSIVSNLIKIVPGVGTLVGGSISGATAGVLTTALGETYIKIMEKIYTGEIKKDSFSSAKGKREMRRIFKEELKKNNK